MLRIGAAEFLRLVIDDGPDPCFDECLRPACELVIVDDQNVGIGTKKTHLLTISPDRRYIVGCSALDYVCAKVRRESINLAFPLRREVGEGHNECRQGLRLGE